MESEVFLFYDFTDALCSVGRVGGQISVAKVVVVFSIDEGWISQVQVSVHYFFLLVEPLARPIVSYDDLVDQVGLLYLPC